MDVRIGALTELSHAEVERLIVGYTSSKGYAVRSTEDAERVTFTLELIDLPRPFEKRWRYSPDMTSWFNSLLRDGLSVAAWDKGELVALGVVQRQAWNDTAIVWELHVAEPHRRQGIAGRLLAEVEALSRRAGLRCVSIETQSANAGAIAFYRACGYAMEGLDLRYYANDDVDRGEVAVFMKKALA